MATIYFKDGRNIEVKSHITFNSDNTLTYTDMNDNIIFAKMSEVNYIFFN